MPGADWSVYMLRCRDGSLYTGIAADLDRRVAEHRRGTASKYTRTRLPVRLVFQERQADRSSASKREAQIKRLTRTQKLALIRARSRRSLKPAAGLEMSIANPRFSARKVGQLVVVRRKEGSRGQPRRVVNILGHRPRDR